VNVNKRKRDGTVAREAVGEMAFVLKKGRVHIV